MSCLCNEVSVCEACEIEGCTCTPDTTCHYHAINGWDCQSEECDGRAADEMEYCPECEAYQASIMREAYGEWRGMSAAERNPEGYRRDMVDAGRGGMLKVEE